MTTLLQKKEPIPAEKTAAVSLPRFPIDQLPENNPLLPTDVPTLLPEEEEYFSYDI